MDSQEDYRINLPQFEGPFDLLLFFIQRDELDIHDIPISTITDDFLAYIQQMQDMNLDVASEFILVASTLMRIKAKMLLPRPVFNEEGEEIDPREELVRRLLEYKRYKSVIEELMSLESDQQSRVSRGYAREEEKSVLQSEFPEEELVGMDLYTIMRTFRRIWDRHQDKMDAPKHVIRPYPYTLDQVKSNLMERLLVEDRIDFVSFILAERNRVFVVFSFLSILELTQAQRIHITVGDGYNNFWISKKEAPKEDEA